MILKVTQVIPSTCEWTKIWDLRPPPEIKRDLRESWWPVMASPLSWYDDVVLLGTPQCTFIIIRSFIHLPMTFFNSTNWYESGFQTKCQQNKRISEMMPETLVQRLYKHALQIPPFTQNQICSQVGKTVRPEKRYLHFNTPKTICVHMGTILMTS